MVRSLLRRLLFVRAPDAPALTIAAEDDRFVLTGFVRGGGHWRRISRAERAAGRLAAHTHDHREEWGLEDVTTMRGTLRWFASIMRFTRTHRSVRFLCGLAGAPAPSPYHLKLSPEYDAAVELVFANPPSEDLVAKIIAQGPTDATWTLSHRQVLVYDEPVDRRPYFLCFLVHRPPSKTRAECQHYWETEHAQLVLHNMRYLRLTQYRQVHTIDRPPTTEDGATLNVYDGVVYARKAGLLAVLGQLVRPNSFRFNDTLVVDETHFSIDTPAMVMRPARSW